MMTQGLVVDPARGVLEGGGLRIPKHPNVTVGRLRRFLRQGTYEEKEVRAARRIVKKDDTVLELGGGIGYMSTVAAKLCDAKEVHTFEANPTLLPYMRAMHAENGVADRVTIHNALLGAPDTPPQTFYIRENFVASSLDADSAPYQATAEIEVRDLNATLKTLKPTVLICDIEGAEAHLFPMGDFSMLRAVIVELHPQWIRQSGVQAVFDAMHRAGLSYFHRGSEGKVVVFRRDF